MKDESVSLSRIQMLSAVHNENMPTNHRVLKKSANELW